ncbi:uncharacterized protein LAESUDRAFT_808312 [Laetiporus sulphureus 93-53]|uniref:DNA polymerase delta subunit 3 n=1 Tax=Laetiporus sulphureus 93-53 TaxID=1314785 RepID=A0A165I9J4_9APHY|nr:uncharacterized protein LAESUDRAFT_808312 [Laetiporus sulphureus 93-53]KZT12769.1 hypothetical protein LAESUDRAFT_808312 [Laetiporus sulphureus 93-53]
METERSDYLTKQLVVERNVVTFRSLSRHFNIHVNFAKNDLAAFHAASQGSPSPAYATYLLTGEVLPPPATTSQESQPTDMDVDLEEVADDSGEPDSEEVPAVKVTLVGETDVDRVKSQYKRLFSQHIYSLSPAPLIDAGLICPPSDKVHELDAKISSEASVLLGRIVGPHVHIGRHIAPVASSSKVKDFARSKSSLSVKQEQKVEKAKEELEQAIKKEPKEEPKLTLKEHAKHKEKPPALKVKESGKLDWSKAKAKETEEKIRTVKGKQSVKDGFKKRAASGKKSRATSPSTDESSRQGTPAMASSKTVVKRGTKRKSGMMPSSDSDEEDDSVSPPPRKKSPISKSASVRPTSSKDEPKRTMKRKPTLRLMLDSEEGEGEFKPLLPTRPKKGVVLSEDEEFEKPDTYSRPASSRRKARPRSRRSETPTEAEKSLRAMMDVDDDEVIRVSHSVPPDTEPEADETQNEDVDVEMVEDSEPERVENKPRRKREKKVIPTGRNGLKKRRVLKSRTKVDEKGYMITEDYSSYESVEEEEEQADESAKIKTKRSSFAKGHTKPKIKVNDRTASKTSGDSSGLKSRKSTAKTPANSTLMTFFGKK